MTQTIEIQQNPFSGRPDVIGLSYLVANRDTSPLAIGVRALLDIKLGQNDGAPYFIPGVGAVTTEREFVGGQVPDYWLAFESPTYDPRELRSVGVLRGRELTTPDRFMIAWWRRLQFEKWDYPIDPTRPDHIGQRGRPVLGPGDRVAREHAVHGDPVRADHQPRRLRLRLGAGGIAMRRYDLGRDLRQQLRHDAADRRPGHDHAFRPAFRSPRANPPPSRCRRSAPGGTGSAAWSVRLASPLSGSFKIDASASFDGNRQFTASANVNVTCPLPSATPTAKSCRRPRRPCLRRSRRARR